MGEYGVSYQSRDRSEYGTFSVRGKNNSEAYSAAVSSLKRRGKNPANYHIAISGDEEEEE